MKKEKLKEFKASISEAGIELTRNISKVKTKRDQDVAITNWKRLQEIERKLNDILNNPVGVCEECTEEQSMSTSKESAITAKENTEKKR